MSYENSSTVAVVEQVREMFAFKEHWITSKREIKSFFFFL